MRASGAKDGESGEGRRACSQKKATSQQRAEQPGGGRCATNDTTAMPAVTTKTSAKIIAICFIIAVTLSLGHNADIRVGTGACHRPNNTERAKNRKVSAIMIGKSFW